LAATGCHERAGYIWVSLHDLPALVVDDNATNRHFLAEWLRGWQMNPTAVGDGMAAMDALRHRDPGSGSE
jgi:CheY-like chemotaxis protein